MICNPWDTVLDADWDASCTGVLTLHRTPTGSRRGTGPGHKTGSRCSIGCEPGSDRVLDMNQVRVPVLCFVQSTGFGRWGWKSEEFVQHVAPHRLHSYPLCLTVLLCKLTKWSTIWLIPKGHLKPHTSLSNFTPQTACIHPWGQLWLKG